MTTKEGNNLIASFTGEDQKCDTMKLMGTTYKVERNYSYHSSLEWQEEAWLKLLPLLQNKEGGKQIIERFNKAIIVFNKEECFNAIVEGVKLVTGNYEL